MPEGDSLFRLAAKLRPALVGKVILELSLPRSELGEVPGLVGRKVSAVESRGKNLLIHFDDGSALHTHLRMSGSWRLYAESPPWMRRSDGVVAALRVAGATAVCLRAPTVRLLRPGAAEKDPRLRALGPDLLSQAFDLESARRRLRALGDEPLGVAVMDQRAVAGIGNVYKSEVLFLRGLDPFQLVERVSDTELEGVLLLAAELLAKNSRAGPPATRAWPFGVVRTTRGGAGPGGGPVHVYGRSGRPCFVCGATIRMKRQGSLGRSTYFCPECQRGGGGVPASELRGGV